MSVFPSMISCEPPPINSDEEEDVEDEFRSNGLHLDISSDPSPISTPRKPPLNSSATKDEDKSDIKCNGECSDSSNRINEAENIPSESVLSIKDSFEGDQQIDLINSVQSDVETNAVKSIPAQIFIENITDNDMCSTVNIPAEEDAKLSEESNTIVNNETGGTDVTIFHDYSSNHTELSNDLEEFQNSPVLKTDSDLDLSKISGESVEVSYSEEPSPTEVSYTNNDLESNNKIDEGEDDDDFGEFGAASFDEPKTEQNQETTLPNQDLSNVVTSSSFPLPLDKPAEDFEAFGEFSAFEESSITESKVHVDCDLDNDFGDFSCPTEPITVKTSTVSADFRPPRRESLHFEERFSAFLKSVFPSDFPVSEELVTTILQPLDQQLANCACSEKNKAWSHVIEFEDSFCLRFKWPRSGFHEILLESLHIDTSTVIYTEKYGAIEVPKFAKSLVDSPLQPQSVASPITLTQTTPNSTSSAAFKIDEDEQDCFPMENPVGVKEETVHVLEQLPDLSYMLAKTLVFPRNPKY